MMLRTHRAALLAALCLAAAPALAATTHSADGRFTYAPPARHGTVAAALPAGTTVLFSNFATAYPNGLYFSGLGNTITGPGVPLNPGIASAAQFTVSKGGTASGVYAAIGLLSGNAMIDLAIYTDNGGVPGNLLWSSETKVRPPFGTCCGVIKATISGGLPLTANTPYWLVATADAPVHSNFNGAWSVSTINQVTDVLAATNFNGAGWQSYPTNTPPAFAITGE